MKTFDVPEQFARLCIRVDPKLRSSDVIDGLPDLFKPYAAYRVDRRAASTPIGAMTCYGC